MTPASYEYLDCAWRIAMTGMMIKTMIDMAIVKRRLHMNGNGKRR